MLTIIRGMPGSGKSTLGRRLAAEQNALFIEPDMLMYQNGEYKYDPASYSVAVGAHYARHEMVFKINCDWICAPQNRLCLSRAIQLHRC